MALEPGEEQVLPEAGSQGGQGQGNRVQEGWGTGEIWWPTAGQITGWVGDERPDWDHAGIDIEGELNQPIYAAMGGTVEYIGYDPTSGWEVKIRGTDGRIYRYLHMFQKGQYGDTQVNEVAAILGFNVGDTVEQGARIGFVGDSGNPAAGAYHLHFAVYDSDMGVVNPLSLLKGGNTASPEGAGLPLGAPSVGDPSTSAGYLPSDTRVYTVGGRTFAVFKVTAGDGRVEANIVAEITAANRQYILGDLPAAQTLPQQQWDAFMQNALTVSSVTDLLWENPAQFGSFQEWFTEELVELAGYNPVIKRNDEVFEVYVQALIQGWEPETLANALEQTRWYQSHTDIARQWQQATSAQRQQMWDDWTGQFMDTWRSAFGTMPEFSNEQLRDIALQVATGQLTEGRAVDQIWQLALQDPNSTASQQANLAGQRVQTIENKVLSLKAIARSWGTNFSDDVLLQWATWINDFKRSDADFLEKCKARAEARYGSVELGNSTRGRDTQTDDWAAGFTEAYSTLMEVPNTGDVLFAPLVQKAMRGSMSVPDFEEEIRRTDAWRTTRNARETFAQRYGQIGRMMGFM